MNKKLLVLEKRAPGNNHTLPILQMHQPKKLPAKTKQFLIRTFYFL